MRRYPASVGCRPSLPISVAASGSIGLYKIDVGHALLRRHDLQRRCCTRAARSPASSPRGRPATCGIIEPTNTRAPPFFAACTMMRITPVEMSGPTCGRPFDAFHQQHALPDGSASNTPGNRCIAVEDALARLAAVHHGDRRCLRRVGDSQLRLQHATDTTPSARRSVGECRDGDARTGLVTSPAVKLSPKARKRVREMRGGFGVGPVGPLLPPQPAATTGTGECQDDQRTRHAERRSYQPIPHPRLLVLRAAGRDRLEAALADDIGCVWRRQKSNERASRIGILRLRGNASREHGRPLKCRR